MKVKSLFLDQLLTSPHILPEVKEDLKGCTVIEATNVSDYYFQGTEQEIWDIKTDFPNIAPPFRDFFLEFKAPSQVTSQVHGTYEWEKDKPVAWGVRCTGEVTRDLIGDRKEVLEGFKDSLKNLQKIVETFMPISEITSQEQFDMLFSKLSPQEKKIHTQFIQQYRAVRSMERGEWEEIEKTLAQNAADAKWYLRMEIYWKTASHQCVGPLWYYHIPVDEQGNTYRLPDGESPFVYGPLGEIAAQMQRNMELGRVNAVDISNTLASAFAPMMHTALLAISFMHCKNVKLIERIPPTIQLTAKQKRWGVKPRQLVTYHVLDIEPMKQVLKTEGQCEKVGLQRSLHICRGHFANYTEKGLFGKYRGTFWIPQHVRGSHNAGITLKDYRVKI